MEVHPAIVSKLWGFDTSPRKNIGSLLCVHRASAVLQALHDELNVHEPQRRHGRRERPATKFLAIPRLNVPGRPGKR